MMRFKKVFLLMLLTIGGFFAGFSQMKITIDAPAQVAEGTQFRVVFSTNGDVKSFKGPSFKGFSVLSGPNPTQSYTSQSYNGKTVSQVSVSYSYVIQAGSVGKYTIGQASAVVGGQTCKSTPHTVEVVKGNPRSAAKTNAKPQQETQSANITANDLFVKAVPNKTTAYQGEEVLILYKLYFNVSIARYGIAKLPSSNGFWSNELTDKKSNPRQYAETVNGRNMNVADLRKMAVYAQKNGRLTIDPLQIDIVAQIRQQRQRQSIFDDFFMDPFPTVQNVEKKIKSNPLSIQILPFPEPRPEAFNGVVGNYNVKCSIDKNSVKTNDAITLSVTFSGKGNLGLIDAPVFDFPVDFEVYDPKIKDNIVTSLSGLSGSRTFEYLIIPRNPGKFEIKSIDIVTFNPATKSYQTYQTPDFSLVIEKGNGYTASVSSMANQKDVKYLNSDVRFIKNECGKWIPQRYALFFSWGYFLIMFLVCIMFSGFVFYYRKQITMRKDIGLMRNKQASKLARKRLSKAHKFMKSNMVGEFYIEISQVIWGYVADKCNISNSQLSMEIIRQELEKIEVNNDVIADFVNLINDCEFARFAPGNPVELMQQFYDRTFNAIITLEKQMK